MTIEPKEQHDYFVSQAREQNQNYYELPIFDLHDLTLFADESNAFVLNAVFLDFANLSVTVDSHYKLSAVPTVDLEALRKVE